MACGAALFTGMALWACVDFGSLQSAVSDAAAAADVVPRMEAAVEAGPFCNDAGAHYLCADWDNVGTPEVGWTGSVVSGGPGGGAIARQLGVYVSPPASFASSVQNGSTMGGTYAVLHQVITPHPSSVTLAADILPSATRESAFDGGASFLGFQDVASTDAGSAFYSTSLGLDTGAPGFTTFTSSYLKTDGTYGVFGQSNLPPLGASWTRVVMRLDFGPPQHVLVTFGGTTVVDQKITDSAPVPGATLNANVGIISVGGGALQASYDNVTIDVVP
jgi:hypothetical protein